MNGQLHWLQMLALCRDNVQEQIKPHIKTLNQQQPELGIGAGGDPMRQIDLAAENAIVNTFRKHRISFTLISEESGIRKYGSTPGECYVTADPVDGSTNLMRGLPFYATSIAISTSPTLNTVHTALVTDLFHGVTYTAQKGRGAYRNNQRIEPSKVSSLEEAVIGVDLNTYKIQEIVPRIIGLMQRTKHIRHLGANALELCYVADGTTDAFVDIRGKLRTTDMAAAWLIAKEAGAKMTTPEGKPLKARLNPKQTLAFVTCANQAIHEAILGLIAPEKEKP